MNYIVLTSEQKDRLETHKANFLGANPSQERTLKGYKPIEILTKDSDGLPCYILPISVLSDERLMAFNQYVMQNKTSDMVVREVNESEIQPLPDI